MPVFEIEQMYPHCVSELRRDMTQWSEVKEFELPSL